MPERFTNRIVRLLTRKEYQPLKPRAFARSLHISDEDYPAFNRALEKLRNEGRIVIGAKGTVCLPQMANRLVGTFQATSRGFGFVRPETPTAQGDLYIPAGCSLDAVTGDTVVTRVYERGKRDGETRYTGRIVEVLNRAETQFVGTLTRKAKEWFVQPDGKAITELIAVGDPGAKNAKLGDKVVVEILSYPSGDYFASGVIIDRLGRSGTSAAELKAVMRRFDLPERFSRTALKDTRRAVDAFNAETADSARDSQREDIRKKTIITIDPIDARDFDDAISLERLAKGHWLLGVHIADVSEFVTEGTHLDDEARQRATSTYLPQHVIPMLPELLSNGICSLQQDQDRFAKTAYIELDSRGRVVGTRFANSLIRSTQRLSYGDAETILAGKTTGFSRKAVKLLREMESLARVIQKRRLDKGMLTLDLPKAELVYNSKGQVIDASPESTSFPHKMIEMFMLEANEAVARLLDSLTVPFLRRTHAAPDSLAVGDTARIVKLCGYILPKRFDRKALQHLLTDVKDKPQAFVVNLAVLKSLQRAEYSPAPIGHFALASEHYCHFTSPIRRYPDLTVHRLLQAYITGRLTRKTVTNFPDYDQLQQLGEHCSTAERNSELAERDLRELKLLQMLSKKLNTEIPAVVTSVTNFGIFVQLEKFLIEGLIRAEDLTKPEKKGHRPPKPPRMPRGHRPPRFMDTCPYKLGDELTVRITDVNIPARNLDLVPVN